MTGQSRPRKVSMLWYVIPPPRQSYSEVEHSGRSLWLHGGGHFLLALRGFLCFSSSSFRRPAAEISAGLALKLH